MLLYLIEVKKSTYSKLAAHFQVSKKTIMRDIDKLSGMGVPVYAQSGYEGGIFIDPDYCFERSYFTSDEIEELVLAFHIASCLRQGHQKSTVLQKLEALFPEWTFLKEYDFGEYLKIELLEQPVSIDSPIVREINIGLDEEVFLKIQVGDMKYTVAPLYYVLRPDGLHLHCCDGTQYYTFSIDAVCDCQHTSETFDRTMYDI